MIIPYKDHTKHKQYFDFCQKLFRCFGITIDPKCYDICRLRFVSYDPDPYINLDAEIFDYVLPPLPSLATSNLKEIDIKTFLESHNISYEIKETEKADGDDHGGGRQTVLRTVRADGRPGKERGGGPAGAHAGA